MARQSFRKDKFGNTRGFELEMGIENEERLEEILAMNEKYEEEAKKLFLGTVLRIHRYLIRLTPVDEMELRGGWTALLRKYQQDFTSEIHDIALYDDYKQQNKTPYYRQYHFDEAAALIGASQSTVIETPFDITLENSVIQGGPMEDRTNFTLRAIWRGEGMFDEAFQEWFESIARAENIIPAPDQSKKGTQA